MALAQSSSFEALSMAKPPAKAVDATKSLFDQRIPVALVYRDRETRRGAHLTFAIELEATGSASSSSSVLHILLTDDSNPFFLYTLDMDEEDFKTLKQEQNLNVDFTTFPKHLIEFLEHCLRGSKANSQGTFVAQMDCHSEGKDGVLYIYEMNGFRTLSHLTLLFRAANDHTIKRYLAARLTDWKTRYETTSRQLRATEEALRLAEAAATEAQRRGEDLSTTASRASDELRLQHAAHIAELKEQALKAQRELQDKYERKVEALTAENLSLKERLGTTEATAKELTTRLQEAQRDVVARTAQLAKLQEDAQLVDSLKFTHERELNEIRRALAVAEQKLSHKDELIRQIEGSLEAIKQQKAAVEEALAASKANAASLEEMYHATSQEIARGNHIIEKLKAKMKALQSELKVKKAVIQKQDKLLGELQQRLDDANRQCSTLTGEMSSKQLTIDRLNQELAGMKETLKDNQELLAKNQTVIAFLNKKLLEEKLAGSSSQPSIGRASTGPPMMRFTAPLPSDVPPFAKSASRVSPVASVPLPSPLPTSTATTTTPTTTSTAAALASSTHTSSIYSSPISNTIGFKQPELEPAITTVVYNPPKQIK